jgi:hypothetical protein
VTLPLIDFPTLGWQVIQWMEAYLVHGPGDVQGDPFGVDDELALHLCWAYRVHPQGHPQAGRRLVQRAVLSRPKGRAKSEIAGAVACAEALGPVRCDGFDAQGRPVGKPVTYPFIRCLATEEEQSGNTYDNVHYMLSEGEAANAYDVDVGLTRTFIREPGGGEIVPSTAASASKEGGKESLAIPDETHLYITRELRTMYRTVARNTGKRKEAEPWLFETTTAYEPGEQSVAELVAERYGAMPPEEAVVKHGVLYDHRQGDEPKRFGDDRSLAKALRAGYGPAAEWMDFQRIVRVIRDAEDPEAEAYRYWLNRARPAASHWLVPGEIQEALRPETVVPRGTSVTLGFDGSLSDDHTALFLCTEEGLLVPVGVWAGPPGSDSWQVPVDEVDAAVAWAFEQFRVVRMYGDPPWWQDSMARWAQRHGSPPVVEFWTNHDTKMAVACGALRTALRHGDATIDPMPLRTDPQTRAGKPLVVWHFENARTRKVRVRFEDRAEEAHTVRKDRPGSDKKIDSVPAAVLARRARDDAVKAGEFKPRRFARATW